MKKENEENMQQRKYRVRGACYVTGFLITALGTMLAGCGSSGGGEGSTDHGAEDPGPTSLFVDSPVAGLGYDGVGGDGVTRANGEFDFKEGASVTFSVGGIVLGTLVPGVYSSPLDMVEGADELSDSDTVLNIVRFLQTLDADSDPSTGIDVTEEVRAIAVGMSVNFEQDTEDFEVDPEVLLAVEALVPGATLVSAESAIAHFNASLAAMRAGSYEGSISGDHEGGWRMTTSNDGELMMIAANDDEGDFVLFGNLHGDGTFMVYGTEAVFNGRIVDGEVSGTWFGIMDYLGSNGTFSGMLVEYGLAFMDEDLLAGFSLLEDESISGTYTGDDESSGAFVLSMEEDEHGRDAVSLLVDDYFPSALYPTAITETHISFSGINARGVIFSGTLSTTGEVEGSYVPIDPGDSGGTFSGSL